jgi:arylsulfatase A-like enzyme
MSDTKQKRPNVLLFFTDDQRFDTIRALGNDQIFTPNLDYLVRNGTTFENGYIMGGTCPAVCMPSRAMLMTGRTLFHLEGSGEDIPKEHVMLGETLQRAGYDTFGTGKWHNGPASYARSFNHGAEIFFGGMDDHWNVPACAFDPSGKYPDPRPHHFDPGTGQTEERMKSFDHINRGRHSSELFADAAIDFMLNRETDNPFFAYISFMAPHDPRTMPQRFLNMYDSDKIRLPENYLPEHPFDNGEMKVRDELLEEWPRRPERIRRHTAEYYAMISHLDNEVGRVLDALKATKEFENTIVVFAGDNGLAIGRHGLMGKQSNYDHSIHVPLMFMGPGVPRGQKREAYAYLLDIYPTLCDLIGLERPSSVEGQSLVPALKDPDERIRDHLLFAYRDVQRSVMEGRFKLIEYVVDGTRTTQLFDLVADPMEQHNLAGQRKYSKKIEDLRGKLRGWKKWDDRGESFWRAFE